MPQNYLKEILKEKGLRPVDLARKVNLTSQRIWSFSNGHTNLNNDLIKSIIAALGISYEYLMTGKKDHAIIGDRKELMFKAIKLVQDYYKDQGFDDDFMIIIATELYNILLNFEEKGQASVKDNSNFIEELEHQYHSGLAAKCFSDFLKNKTK